MAQSTTGLSRSEKLIVGEALRRGEQARDVMEGALVDFGRWVLVNVFADDADAAAALGDRRGNRVWQDLMTRAGGPTLRVSERLIRRPSGLRAVVRMAHGPFGILNSRKGAS